MSTILPKAFNLTRAGSSFVDGSYSLDTTGNTIKYVQYKKHPLSNKPMSIEIVKTKIAELDPKQTYFLIQVACPKKSKPVHYYASKSPFTSPTQRWLNIAGLDPGPIISIPPSSLKQMMSSTAAPSYVSPTNQPQEATSNRHEDSDTKLPELSNVKPTIRSFLTDTYLFEKESVIVYSGRDSKHGEYVVLKDTIFHPQGGGQPTDKGTIRTLDAQVVFNVEFVANHSLNADLVCHFGSYATQNAFKINDKIRETINQSERELFAKLHSGGHLIDIGMTLIGQKLGIQFEPIKGYHFPKGAYVEYEGNIPQEQRNAMKELLQNELDALISNNPSVETMARVMDCEEYLEKVVKLSGATEKEQHMNKMKLTKGSKVRVLSIDGFPNGECMCGGTHIDRIGRIKRIVVTKFKKKNRNFRVSYQVE